MRKSWEHRYNIGLFYLACVLCLASLLSLKLLLPMWNHDQRDYLLPWYQHILRFGRLRSLEGSYANYSPPYLYLISAASSVGRFFPNPIYLIKCLNLPFMLLAGVLSALLLKRLGASRLQCWTALLLLPFLPEVVLNSLAWAQCDIIPTSLLLGTLLLQLRGRRLWAAVLLGVTLAFKLQPIFVAPALLGFALAGEVSALQIVLIPLAVVVTLLPAHLAGRSWHSLTEIYSNQYGYYQKLSMNAPNPYVWLEPHWHHVNAFVRAGFVSATLASCFLAWYYWRHPRLHSAWGRLSTACLSLLMLPYLLPRMHERYFFAGDCLLAILAVRSSRYFLPAVMMQVATALSYWLYLGSEPPIEGTATNMNIPILLATASLLLVARNLYQDAHRLAAQDSSTTGAVA